MAFTLPPGVTSRAVPADRRSGAVGQSTRRSPGAPTRGLPRWAPAHEVADAVDGAAAVLERLVHVGRHRHLDAEPRAEVVQGVRRRDALHDLAHQLLELGRRVARARAVRRPCGCGCGATCRWRSCRRCRPGRRRSRSARPRHDPSRMTSARLRVIRLARVLSPKPRPSDMPTAMAMGFLAAPQNSTPTTSALRYTRKVSLLTTACRRWARSSSSAAITVAEGMSRRHLFGVVGPGERRRRRAGLLGDDLRGPLERRELQTLGERQLQAGGRPQRRGPRGDLADGLRGHRVHQQLGALQVGVADAPGRRRPPGSSPRAGSAR